MVLLKTADLKNAKDVLSLTSSKTIWVRTDVQEADLVQKKTSQTLLLEMEMWKNVWKEWLY